MGLVLALLAAPHHLLAISQEKEAEEQLGRSLAVGRRWVGHKSEDEDDQKAVG